LDGFIADAENSLDWLLQFGDGSGEFYSEFIGRVGAIVMGSTTYEWVLQHPMQAEDGSSIAWPYEQPAWVFSSRELPTIEGADIRFVRGDVRPVYEEMQLAAGGKNIWLVGGGELVGQFYDQGLLDEIIVAVAPVTLGDGAPVLPRKITAPHLKLVSVSTMDETFAMLRYEVPKP
jgi:dihydrofolate reductase